MSELLPCPICGRKATIFSWWNEAEECGMANIGCSSESHVSGYECVRIHVSRVDEKTAKEDAIRIWNTRAERTCHVVSSYFYDDYDIHEFQLSCGHEITMHDAEPPNYCPNCGAKVVDNDTSDTREHLRAEDSQDPIDRINKLVVSLCKADEYIGELQREVEDVTHRLDNALCELARVTSERDEYREQLSRVLDIAHEVDRVGRG